MVDVKDLKNYLCNWIETHSVLQEASWDHWEGYINDETLKNLESLIHNIRINGIPKNNYISTTTERLY